MVYYTNYSKNTFIYTNLPSALSAGEILFNGELSSKYIDISLQL